MCAGDIGTSPLYTYSTVFWEPPAQLDVLCAASLVFWSITLVVLVKYVLIVMLADDNGEGARPAVAPQEAKSAEHAVVSLGLPRCYQQQQQQVGCCTAL